MSRIEDRSPAQQFLQEVATFANSPAGEALLATDPAMVAKLFIDRAKELDGIGRKRLSTASATKS